MNKELELLIAEAKKAQDAVNNYADGYDYTVKASIYGASYTDEFKNEFTAMEFFNSFNGDNGLATLYTNNPNIEEVNGDYVECKIIRI